MLLILLFAPGLAVRAAFPTLTREESIGEAVFNALFISILVSGWIALVLAEVGAFSLETAGLAAVVVSLGIVAARRRKWQSPLPRLQVTRWGAAWLIMLGAAAWLFFQPNEYTLGGRDHGVYVNAGVTIARTGGITLADAALTVLTPDQRSALVEYQPLERGDQSIPRAWHAGTAAPGYYLFHLDSPNVTPHGFHLYPAWFAVLSAAGGVMFSLYLTPMLAWLGLIAFGLSARRAFGHGVALLAMALLAVNLAQVWYARTPSAEILVQFLFWSGVWAWVRAIQTGRPIFGLLGGLAWGQIHLAKIDYVTLSIVLLAWAAWAWWTGRYRRYHTAGLIGYAAMVTHAIGHGLLVAPSYSFDVLAASAPAALVDRLSRAAAESAAPFDLAWRLFTDNALIIAAFAVALALAGIGLRRARGRGAAAWSRFEASRWGWPSLAISIVTLCAYAYFVRPLLAAAPGATTFVELSWYLGTLAMALGVIGLARRMGRADPTQGLIAWSLIGLSAVLLAGGSFTFPDHFWAMRRFVPVIVPGFVLLAADAVASIAPQRWSDWRGALVPIVLGGGMFLAATEALVPFVRFMENRGVTDRLRGLDSAIEPGAVLLFDRDASGAQVGTPLEMIFGRPVAFVGEAQSGDPALASAVAGWQRDSRPVYYFASAVEPIDVPGFSLDYSRTVVVSWLAAELTVAFRPTRIDEAAATFDVFRVVPEQSVEDRVVTLDVGLEASEPFVSGVYPDPPVSGLRTAPWTEDTATFTLQIDARPRQLLFRLSGPPPVAPAASIDVAANGERLGAFTAGPGMSVYTLRFPDDAQAVGSLTIALRLNTWNPRALGYNADRRDLGAQIDWVKIVAEKP
jgi:hypothetical protein